MKTIVPSYECSVCEPIVIQRTPNCYRSSFQIFTVQTAVCTVKDSKFISSALRIFFMQIAKMCGSNLIKDLVLIVLHKIHTSNIFN